ncbi:MAG: hypothetical protein GY757_49295, partial [bacterium]|nr:hypothetical protein [bacterium]
SESKVAPQLISGSWVGWLMEILRFLLNPRYTILILEPFPDNEALQAVYNYGKLMGADLTEESALAVQALSRNHPFYISCLIRSNMPNKDLTTAKGIETILNYETTNKRQGEIYIHWMEYIESAFAGTNGKIAKALVLFLSKERHVEKTRPEILAYLKTKDIEMEDEELDKRLRLLVKGDIIAEGSSAFQYQGIPDDLLNHVVQTRYEYEIENIKNEETAADIARQNREKRESVSQAIIDQNKG